MIDLIVLTHAFIMFMSTILLARYILKVRRDRIILGFIMFIGCGIVLSYTGILYFGIMMLSFMAYILFESDFIMQLVKRVKHAK